MKRGALRGFTLIELLMVISILAVVSTLGTFTLVRTWELWGNLHLAAQLDRTAENAFESMHKDFSGAVASTNAGEALRAAKGDVEDPRMFGFHLANDRFTFPIEMPATKGTVVVRVGYQLEQQDDAWALVRTLEPLRGGGEPSKQTVAEGVIQMRVEYAGAGGGWSDSWTGEGNPRAVRVSLTLAAPGHPLRLQTARKAVFTVHVP